MCTLFVVMYYIYITYTIHDPVKGKHYALALRMILARIILLKSTANYQNQNCATI